MPQGSLLANIGSEARNLIGREGSCMTAELVQRFYEINPETQLLEGKQKVSGKERFPDRH